MAATASKPGFLTSSAKWSIYAAVAACGSCRSRPSHERPVNIDEASPDELLTYVQQDWDDEGWEQRVAEVLGKYLISLRSRNKYSARQLVTAIGFEIFGIGATGLAWAYCSLPTCTKGTRRCPMYLPMRCR